MTYIGFITIVIFITMGQVTGGGKRLSTHRERSLIAELIVLRLFLVLVLQCYNRFIYIATCLRRQRMVSHQISDIA